MKLSVSTITRKVKLARTALARTASARTASARTPLTRYTTLLCLSGLCIGGLCFGGFVAPQAIANSRPPITDDPPPNTRGRSAGSRGCSTAAPPSAPQPSAPQPNVSQNAAIPALILLAPDSAGRTISTQPTFAWFNRDGNETTPTVFRLYEYDTATQSYQLLIESQGTPIQGEPGIIAASLAEEMATLTVGSRYLWQVGLVCDPNRPSGDLFAEAEFEVTAPSVTLTRQLNDAPSPADKAELLLQAGLWYDALPLLFSSANNSPNPAPPEPSRMPSVRANLFEQVSFSETEQTQLESSTIYFIEIDSPSL
ncbi:MAG: DUF928 domain-containing protein [Phormidesmis sp.]